MTAPELSPFTASFLDYPQEYILSCFYSFLKTVSVFKKFVEYSIKAVYPIMVRKMFKFVVFLLLELALVNQKNWKQIFLLLATLSPRFLILHPTPQAAEANYSLPQATFFQISPLRPNPAERRGKISEIVRKICNLHNFKV